MSAVIYSGPNRLNACIREAAPLAARVLAWLDDLLRFKLLPA